MKLPLLEYLDKLEAAATVSPGVLCSINGAIAAALIAKLRELAKFADGYWLHIFGEDAPLEIEVPE